MTLTLTLIPLFLLFPLFLFCRLFGFIVHSAQDQFIAHVFHCEPSVGAICKTIQAACMVSTKGQRVGIGGGVEGNM